MMEAKDEKELGFDRDGNYVGLVPEDERTHYDVMHYKYKQCAKCHKWYKEEEYPLKTDGTPTKCCENCLEAMKKAQEARKAKDSDTADAKPTKRGRKKKEEVPEQPPINGQNPATSTIHFDLSQVPPQDLIQEMRRRGWKGNIQVVMDFEL